MGSAVGALLQHLHRHTRVSLRCEELQDQERENTDKADHVLSADRLCKDALLRRSSGPGTELDCVRKYAQQSQQNRTEANGAESKGKPAMFLVENEGEEVIMAVSMTTATRCLIGLAEVVTRW